MKVSICCCLQYVNLSRRHWVLELVFGHVPRGPLKMLRGVWLAPEDTQDVITHVTYVHQRLQKATEFARKNLKSA